MTKMQLRDILHRAENALRISDYESAEQYALEASKGAPNSVQAGMLLGTVYGRLERYEEAVKQFKRVLKNAPKNSEALNNLGVMYRLLGRPDDARKALQSSLEIEPDRADVLYNLGNIHKAAGEFDEAISCYERAIETDPSFVLAYNNLGTIFQKQGNHTQAVEVFNNGLQHDLNHPTIRYNLGISYDALGKLPDARRQFEHALRSRPGWTDALNNLGIVLEKLERYDESIRHFKEVLEIDDKNHVARNNIATVLARQGNTEDAFSYYAESLKADPTYERAAANLGSLFEKNPPKDSDFDVLKDIFDRAPQNVELQFQYAKALMGAQRYDEAERAVERAQVKRADDPRTLRMTGLLKYRRGDKEGAEKDFSRLREIDPGHVHHHLDVAELLMQSGDTQGALSEVETLLKQEPDNLQAGVMKADVLTRGGRPKEAVKLLKKLKKKNPESVETLTALSRAHQTLGEREKAIGALDELISLQGNRGTPDDLSALNKSLELYEEAARSLADEHSDNWQRNLDKLSRYARTHDAGRPEDVDQELHVESLDAQDEDSVSPWDLGPQSFQAAADDDLEQAATESGTPEDDEPELDEWEPELPPAMRDMIESGTMPFGDQDRSGAASGQEAEAEEIPFMRDYPPQLPLEATESAPEPQYRPEPQRQPESKGYPPYQPEASYEPEQPGRPEPLFESGVESDEGSQQQAQDRPYESPSYGTSPPYYGDSAPPAGAFDESDEPEAATEMEEPDLSGPFIDVEEEEGESPVEGESLDEVDELDTGDLLDEPDVEDEESAFEEPDVVGPFMDVDDEAETAADAADAADAETADDLEYTEPDDLDSEITDLEPDEETTEADMEFEELEEPAELDELGDEDEFELELGEEPEESEEIEDAEPEEPEEPEEIEDAEQQEEELEGELEPEESFGNGAGHPVPGHAPRRQPAPRSPKKKNGESKAKLLEYLIGLARTLPADKYREFHFGEARARTEALMRRLKGRMGLLKRVSQDRPEAGDTSKGPSPRLTRESVGNTFAYLREMTGAHPDRELAAGMTTGVNRVLEKLRARRENGNG